MIGQMGSFARPSADTGDVLELYLHGYVSSRIINLSRNANGSGTGSLGEEGLPICVAASQVDGLVLSLTPNSHSYNYRSAVLFGYATLVTDLAEKLYAMELITNSVVRDRYRHTRVPPNGAELQSTSVLRVRISAGSAKLRSGVPKDEKADMEDAELVGRVWTGVIPMHYTFEEPVPGPYNKLQQTPGYLQEFVTDFNRDSKETAIEAAMKPMDVPKPKHDD